MKIILLGGSGFVGTNLTPVLQAAGHEVIIGDIAPSETYPELRREADVTDAESLKPLFEGADVIVNLAAVHRDDVRPIERYYEVNVDGARRICEMADACGVSRILFTSSVAIYGMTDGTREHAEEDGVNPFNHYGKSKLEAEQVFLEWEKASPDHRLTMVRPTVLFGEGNRGNFYNLIRQMASGKFLMIGDGRNRKSVAYIGNIVAFIADAAERMDGLQIYNYIDKPDLDMNSLVRTIRGTLGQSEKVPLRLPYWFGYSVGAVFDVLARLSGKRFPISRVRIQKFCANTLFSADRALATGFKPPIPLPEAIARTVRAEFGNGKS